MKTKNEVSIVMIRNFIYFFPVLLTLSFFACSTGEKEESETLVKVNGCDLTCCEFKGQLARELNYDADLKLTRGVREAFLEQLIQEVLLLQEAKRLKLDRKEGFMRAMERHWKSTLIRDLLELKGKEINETILVPQSEIEASYKTIKEEGGTVPSLAEIQDIIVKEIKEKKTSQKLEEWLADLEKKANIQINKKLLFKD